MESKRVVSLAPSVTEIVRELDAIELLVGVTHHCRVDSDDVAAVGGWLNPDFEAIRACEPDLVITTDSLQAAVRDELRERGYRVVHVEPGTLGEVIESFATIGRTLEKPQAGHNLAWRARSRIERVRRLVRGRPKPTVYCEEWSEPPTAAGNWVPEAVRAAGGEYPFLPPGERSREVETAEIETADPEHVFLHVCGRGERSDPEAVLSRDWAVQAVEVGAVHVLDDSLLNQPSPRLLDGIEAMARTLHPDAIESSENRVAIPKSKRRETTTMRVGVGSGNPVKVAAVETALGGRFDASVDPVPIESGVAEQPFGEPETIEGAENRARRVVRSGEYDLGVGLEGGVAEVPGTDGLYLIMWAAVTDGETIGHGAGPRLQLPESVAGRIRGGAELGPVMDDVLGEDDVAKNQGAAGALTDGIIDRQEALEHAVAGALAPFVTEFY